MFPSIIFLDYTKRENGETTLDNVEYNVDVDSEGTELGNLN